MSDVTLTHPVTGASRTVSPQKAVHLKEQGWQAPPAPVVRKGEEPDVPDVEAGRAALAAESGRIPAPQTKTVADKPKPEAQTAGKADAGPSDG